MKYITFTSNLLTLLKLYKLRSFVFLYFYINYCCWPLLKNNFFFYKLLKNRIKIIVKKEYILYIIYYLLFIKKTTLSIFLTLKKYFFGITSSIPKKRKEVNHYNKNKKTSSRELDIEPLMNENFDAEDNTMNVLSKISADEILIQVRSLPETERFVFTLYVMEDYSHKEVAEQLGFSEATSRWHFSNARKKLQEKLKKIEMTSSNYSNATRL